MGPWGQQKAARVAQLAFTPAPSTAAHWVLFHRTSAESGRGDNSSWKMTQLLWSSAKVLRRGSREDGASAGGMLSGQDSHPDTPSPRSLGENGARVPRTPWARPLLGHEKRRHREAGPHAQRHPTPSLCLSPRPLGLSEQNQVSPGCPITGLDIRASETSLGTYCLFEPRWRITRLITKAQLVSLVSGGKSEEFRQSLLPDK